MSMTIKGVDTGATITQDAADILKVEGYSFVGRYLSKTSGINAWKVLKADEAMRIHNAGLAILLIWETSGSRAKAGANAGKEDGTAAKDLAHSLGVPGGTIYFAVDYDAPKSDYTAIEAYLREARSACAPYNAGVYGPKHIVDEMFNRGAVRYFMQCVAWSKGLSEHADIYQWQGQDGAEAKAFGEKLEFKVDLDKAFDCRSSGMWMPLYNQYDDGDGGSIYAPVQNSQFAESESVKWMKDHGLYPKNKTHSDVTWDELADVLYKIIEEKKFSGLLDD